MNDLDTSAFISLFKETFEKCFGHPLQSPLSETESKQLYNRVFEETGLVIGWKSLKNYASYIFNNQPAKQENPSVATLDTLARYVLHAPYTDEIQRKDKESHYPYWFTYKDRYVRSLKNTIPVKKRSVKIFILSAMGMIVMVCLAVYLSHKPVNGTGQFTENFQALREDSLLARGWFVQSPDPVFWSRRGYCSWRIPHLPVKACGFH